MPLFVGPGTTTDDMLLGVAVPVGMLTPVALTQYMVSLQDKVST